jgi:hypothetical protein
MWAGIALLVAIVVFAVLWYSPLGERLGIGRDAGAPE